MPAKPERNSNIVPFRPRVLPDLSTEILPYDAPVLVPDHGADGGGESPDTLRLRDELDRELAALGVCYRRRIFRLFALEEIAEALVEVEDARRAGGVHSPAGLFVSVLQGNTGRSAFR